MTRVDAAGLEELFRQALRRHAHGVTVLTCAGLDGRTYGMTATSVCSVSVSPPQLLACVHRETRARDHIAAAGRFAVSLLASPQQPISEWYAQLGGDKTLKPAWRAPDDTPVIADALAHIQCDVAAIHDEGTHSIFIGRARTVRLGPFTLPLIYFEGAYRTLASVESSQPASSYDALLSDMFRAYS